MKMVILLVALSGLKHDILLQGEKNMSYRKLVRIEYKFIFLFVPDLVWNVLSDCFICPAVLTTEICTCQKSPYWGQILPTYLIL